MDFPEIDPDGDNSKRGRACRTLAVAEPGPMIHAVR
jgi:hypothetical protein